MDTDCLQQTRVPLIGRDDCQLMYDETYREIITGTPKPTQIDSDQLKSTQIGLNWIESF